MIKQTLIDVLVREKALLKGQFTLKSGRNSHYFVNFGQITQAASFSILVDSYASAFMNESLHQKIDLLFGPAYKGIPLVSALSLTLYRNYGIEIPFCYNRKELKAHGEKGQLVGNISANQRILIVDDVLTAGTALNESIGFIHKACPTANVIAILVGLDRQEPVKDSSNETMKHALEAKWNLPIFSILTHQDIKATLSL